MSEAELRELLEKKFVGPLDGFINRFGKEFSAGVEINAKGKVDFVFAKSPEQEAAIEAVNDSANILCPCPVCEAAGLPHQIYITPVGYTCESHLREPEGDPKKAKKCKPKASLGRVMCAVEITPEQARKFFVEGDTGLIRGMKSKKGRSFDANLLLNPKGRWISEFKFAPREKAPGGPKKRPSKRTVSTAGS